MQVEVTGCVCFSFNIDWCVSRKTCQKYCSVDAFHFLNIFLLAVIYLPSPLSTFYCLSAYPLLCTDPMASLCAIFTYVISCHGRSAFSTLLKLWAVDCQEYAVCIVTKRISPPGFKHWLCSRTSLYVDCVTGLWNILKPLVRKLMFKTRELSLQFAKLCRTDFDYGGYGLVWFVYIMQVFFIILLLLMLVNENLSDSIIINLLAIMISKTSSKSNHMTCRDVDPLKSTAFPLHFTKL